MCPREQFRLTITETREMYPHGNKAPPSHEEVGGNQNSKGIINMNKLSFYFRQGKNIDFRKKSGFSQRDSWIYIEKNNSQ